MRETASHQVHDLAGTPATTFNFKIKCFTVIIHEYEGKTILQPLVTKQETETLQELFRNKTLEVWLSNGKSDVALFDVDILKYKQVLQPLTKCSKMKNQVCLKNHFYTVVSCEQCPLSVSEALDGNILDAVNNHLPKTWISRCSLHKMEQGP
jgi:hypothetical protein